MITKIYEFFTHTLYIRIAIEAYIFATLMVISESKYYIKNRGGDTFGHQNSDKNKQVRGNYVSMIFSILILALLISFLMVAIISWWKNKNKMSIDQCKTREFYHGIQKLPKAYLVQQQETENDNDQEHNET